MTPKEEAIQAIEYKLKCYRNGWQSVAIVSCKDTWPIEELAELYNASIVDGRHAHGGYIFLRVPVVRKPTVLSECIELLRKNRELQKKAREEFEKNK